MDGGLDDPLVRMHRWDALRQRLANSTAGRLDPVVDEAVEALIAVLQRYPALTLSRYRLVRFRPWSMWTVDIASKDRVTPSRAIARLPSVAFRVPRS